MNKKLSPFKILLLAAVLLVSINLTGYFYGTRGSSTGNMSQLLANDAVRGNEIILYSAGTYAAPLGGVKGAEMKCRETTSKPEGFARYRAFITGIRNIKIADGEAGQTGLPTAVDFISMPTLYDIPTSIAILGPTGKELAYDWEDLLDGEINMTLSEAGITNANQWWSGCDIDGRIIPDTVIKSTDGSSSIVSRAKNTCSNWGAQLSRTRSVSLTPGSPLGQYGMTTSTTSDWISSSAGDCAAPRALLCIAYNPRGTSVGASILATTRGRFLLMIAGISVALAVAVIIGIAVYRKRNQ